MKCPWQTVEDTYRYSDMRRLNGYGIKKETAFGDCIKDYCPFYHSEDERCDRVDISTGRLQYENDPIDTKEGTAEEESYWTKLSYSDGGFNYQCSSCKKTTVDMGDYCPHCGKKMSPKLRYKNVDGELPYSFDIDDDEII